MRLRGLFHPSSTYGALDSRSGTSPSPSTNVDSKQADTGETVEVVSTGRRSQWIKVSFTCFLGIVGASMAVRLWLRNGLSLDHFDPRIGVLTPVDMDEKRSEDPPGIRNATESSALAFTAVNFYHIRDGKPGVSYPWLKDVKLIEPFRDTILSAVNPREGCHYRWEVRAGNEATLELTALGSRAEVQLTRLGENVISLEEMDDGGIVARRVDETVMVKYVRREIRTLTNDEREELLDAMHVLWEVKSWQGKERFGEEYMDVRQMGRLHFAASSKVFCDHIHDGLGFLTSHSVLTNTFEYYLQLVNPKLTVPYWDFTIESTYDEVDGQDHPSAGRQIRSPLFQTSWFGSVDLEDSQLKDGRWAYTEIPEIDDPSFAGRGDVYSRLRSPWTANARRYVSRGLGKMCGSEVESWYPWPTCKMHYELLMYNEDFYGWVWDSMYDPHGNAHIWLGGVLDCDEAYEEIKKLVGEEAGSTFGAMAFAHRKDMYRDGVWLCSEEETSRGRQIPGLSPPVRCGCLDYDLTQGDDYITVLEYMKLGSDLLEGHDEDTKRTVVKMICDSNTNPGDHLQVLSGTMTNTGWPDENTIVTMPDGTSKQEIVSLYSEECMGHRGSDVFPFGLWDGSLDHIVRTGLMDAILTSESDDDVGERDSPPNRQAAGNTLTNRELLAALDPRQDSLTYIYDAFRWDHCMQKGFDFHDMRNASRYDLHMKSKVGSSRLPLNVRSNGEREHSGDYKR